MGTPQNTGDEGLSAVVLAAGLSRRGVAMSADPDGERNDVTLRLTLGAGIVPIRTSFSSMAAPVDGTWYVSVCSEV